MERICVAARPGIGSVPLAELHEIAHGKGIDALSSELDQSDSDIWVTTEESGRIRVPLAAARQFVADYRAEMARVEQREQRRWQIKNDIRITLIAAGLALAAAALSPVIERAIEHFWP